MPSFQYEVIAGPGERLKGLIDAESSAAAVRELGDRGYHILTIEEALSESRLARQRLKLREVAFFTQQLARLLKSGLPLLKALMILEGQSKRPAFRRVVAELRASIQKGNSLSHALESQSRSFGSWYVSMVRAGEAGGMLEEVLKRLADLLYREMNLRGRVRAALAYPTLMVVVGVLTVYFLLSFVIPRITVLFDEAGRLLPLPTLILIEVSRFFQTFWWAIALGVMALVALIYAGLRTERGRLLGDRLILNTPVLAPLILRTEMTRFSRVLGTLLRSGVPILQALDVTSETLGNKVLQGSVKEMARHVRQGEALSKRIEQESYFPDLLGQVVAVGEESGSLDQALVDLAEEYDGEIERTIETMISMLEPLMIIAVGGAVGFIVLALLLPIFDLNEVIQ